MAVEIRNLSISFPSAIGPVEVVKRVSLTVGREKVAIVGESGSGKSLTARSILKLLPRKAVVTADRLAIDGVDILAANEKTMRAVRGGRAGLIMQDPKYSLNGFMTVGSQIAEAWREHNGGGWTLAMSAAENLLERVLIRDPHRVLHAYPHELSGGMAQRVMIAMMLAPGPDLLIADEPTSALDASVQAEILRLIDELVTTNGMSLILISHDLPLVSRFCDRVVIMYAGRVMEELAASDLMNARHPYTRSLLNCLPSMTHPVKRLPTMTRDPDWLAS